MIIIFDFCQEDVAGKGRHWLAGSVWCERRTKCFAAKRQSRIAG
jgi:hypothetical protein